MIKTLFCRGGILLPPEEGANGMVYPEKFYHEGLPYESMIKTLFCRGGILLPPEKIGK